MLAEAELDALGPERFAQGLAEWLRLAGEHAIGAFDERHRGAHAGHGLGHLHAHGPASEHEQTVRDLGEAGHLAVGPHAFELTEAGYWWDHGLRARGDHHMLGGMLVVAHHHAPGTDQPCRATQQVDVLVRQVGGLGRVVVVRDHEVAPLEGGFGAHAAVHGLPRSRHLACRLQRLARAQQRLGRDAGPVVALAAHELALNDGHPEAAIGQMACAVLAAGARPNHDDVVAHPASPLAVSIA